MRATVLVYFFFFAATCFAREPQWNFTSCFHRVFETWTADRRFWNLLSDAGVWSGPKTNIESIHFSESTAKDLGPLPEWSASLCCQILPLSKNEYDCSDFSSLFFAETLKWHENPSKTHLFYGLSRILLQSDSERWKNVWETTIESTRVYLNHFTETKKFLPLDIQYQQLSSIQSDVWLQDGVLKFNSTPSLYSHLLIKLVHEWSHRESIQARFPDGIPGVDSLSENDWVWLSIYEEIQARNAEANWKADWAERFPQFLFYKEKKKNLNEIWDEVVKDLEFKHSNQERALMVYLEEMRSLSIAERERKIKEMLY